MFEIYFLWLNFVWLYKRVFTIVSLCSPWYYYLCSFLFLSFMHLLGRSLWPKHGDTSCLSIHFSSDEYITYSAISILSDDRRCFSFFLSFLFSPRRAMKQDFFSGLYCNISPLNLRFNNNIFFKKHSGQITTAAFIGQNGYQLS